MSRSTTVAYPYHGTLVEINNRFRSQNYSAWDFAIPDLEGSNTTDQQGTYLFILKQVVLRNNIPTITTGVNDTLILRINNVQRTFVIPQGVYTIGSLVTVLNAGLSSVGAANCNFAYDSDSQKLTYHAGAGNATVFLNPASILSDMNTPYTFNAPWERFLNMIGFFPNVNQLIPGNSDKVASNTVRLQGTAGLYLNVTLNLDILTNINGSPNHLCFIPLDDAAKGATVTYIPSIPATFTIQYNDVHNLRFYITDEWGDKPSVDSDTSLLIHFIILPFTQ